jgi:LysR family transcriptional regulator, low CO2-responsive transcriptional regulator
MTFEQLETFVRVARARSFSRAAVVLDLAQPTLSGRIAQLEGELGAPLFLRRGRAVDLTEAGRALLPFAERMLALRAEARAETLRAATGGLGRLIFGANPTCSQYLAPRMIERFLRAHPGIVVSMRTALSPALMEGLLDGALQLALCSRAQIHVHAEVLWSHTDRLVVVAAPDHPLALHKTVARHDLARYTILSTQAGPTRLGLRHALPVGADPHIAVEVTAGDALTELLKRGVGVTVLPTLAIAKELERGELVSLPMPEVELPDYEVALVRWYGRELAPAAEAFVALLHVTRIADLLAG